VRKSSAETTLVSQFIFRSELRFPLARRPSFAGVQVSSCVIADPFEKAGFLLSGSCNRPQDMAGRSMPGKQPGPSPGPRQLWFYSRLPFSAAHASGPTKPQDPLPRPRFAAVPRPSPVQAAAQARPQAPCQRPHRRPFARCRGRASGVRMPNPTQTRHFVCRLMRADGLPDDGGCRRWRWRCR